MASVLDRYGIKEVADVTFYELDSNGNPTVPALYLDTLKVSTIEQAAETTDATGGKGNAPLITWDYGKSITVTLEDALFSAKSLAIMFGDGAVRTASGSAYVMRTEMFTPTASASTGTTASLEAAGWKTTYSANGKEYTKLNPKFYAANNAASPLTTLTSGETVFCTYDLEMSSHGIIEISNNSFPGTYYVTGDTYARSEASGRDEFFQFIIPKAKVQSENTITLEAEGDPSVFNLSLKVLRPKDGIMMKLVKYDLTGTDSGEAATTLIHNHKLYDPTPEGE